MSKALSKRERYHNASDRVVEQICELMSTGHWSPERRQELADEHGIALRTVDERAAEAGRRIRWAAGGTEGIRSQLQAQLQRLSQLPEGSACPECGRDDSKHRAVSVRAIEVLARIYGLDRAPIRIVDMPDYPLFRDALDEALAPYPAAREAVRRALGDAARASRTTGTRTPGVRSTTEQTPDPEPEVPEIIDAFAPRPNADAP